MSNKKYSYNRSYFDVIDSEDKAYFLGLIYADGYNHSKGLTIKLQDRDVHILKTMKKYMCANQRLYIRRYHDKNPNWRNQYVFKISDPQLSVVLDRIGVHKDKTYNIEFPKWLNGNLEKHFIRGFFDGDGSFSHSVINGYSKGIFRIFGLKTMCESVAKVIKKHTDIACMVYKVNSTHAISLCGNRQIVKLLDWLYDDSSHELRLRRKYEHFINIREKFLENVFLNYNAVKLFAENLNITKHSEWMKHWKLYQKPKNIPFDPRRVYKNDGWISWDNFLNKGKSICKK